MNSDCEKIKDQIADLVTGILPEAQVHVLEQHLNECAACRDYARALKDEDMLLTEFFAKIDTNMTSRQERVLQTVNRSCLSKKTDTLLIRRTIMKSPITKLAAAAVVIVAATIVANWFGGSIDGSGIALGQIIENMKKMPWMVMVTKGPEGVVAEQWLCFDREYWIAKIADGTITSYDYAKRAQYKYDPSSKTVTIDYLSQDIPHFISSPQAVLESLFEQVTEQATKPGTEITHEAGQYKGRKVEIHKLAFSVNELNHRTQLFVDIQRNLLIRMLGSSTDSDGKVVIRGELEFEYPEKGPSNIYDLGVPKSATVMNNLPPENVLEVLSKYQFHRENGPDRYIAIVTIGAQGTRIIYRDGDLLRTEFYGYRNPNTWRENRKRIESNFDSLWEWWTDDNNSELTQVYLSDGKYGYYSYGLPDKIRSYRVDRRNPGHEALDTIGWPILTYSIQPDTEAKVSETDYSRENGLICIEFVRPGKVSQENTVTLPSRKLYYLDPKSDYICVRQESLRQRDIIWKDKDNSWLEGIDPNEIPPDELPQIREVIEVAKTKAGQCYPKRMARYSDDGTPREEKRMLIPTVYLQTDPQFPDGIFDPDNLPK